MQKCPSQILSQVIFGSVRSSNGSGEQSQVNNIAGSDEENEGLNLE